MRAVVFTDTADIRIEARPMPEATEGKLLLKVDACGICGTDLHARQLSDIFKANVVIGHEFAATVVEAGPGVSGFEGGERVVINPMAEVCGRCDACLAGLPNQCRLALLERTCGIGKDGGMAEYVAVESYHAHRIPARVSAEVAAWTEPAAVAIRGVGKARLRLGDSVAIFGAGPIGQLALQAALASGAGETLVIESSEHRRTIAISCGADAAVRPDQLSEIDRQFDVVIDCTGAPAAFDAVLALAGVSGRVVVIGTHTGPVTMRSITPQLKEATISFSMGYRDRYEFATALRLLEEATINVAPLTTAVMPMTQQAKAFAAMRDPESAIKVLLDPAA